MAIINYYSGI